MKLCKPSFEIWDQLPGLEGIYKQIERAGRVCYKSEDKITEDSAKTFVDRMIGSKHTSMLEHGTVYLFIPLNCTKNDYYLVAEFDKNPYTKCIIRHEHYLQEKNGYYITSNLRVLIENFSSDHTLDNDMFRFLCTPSEFHEKRVTVKFICDRGVSHEFVRHKLLCVA